jgi:hypothetical protein
MPADNQTDSSRTNSKLRSTTSSALTMFFIEYCLDIGITHARAATAVKYTLLCSNLQQQF